MRTLSSNPQLASNGVRQRSCSPQRISTEWLVDRTALASQPLSPPTAAAIVKTFVAAQLIDSSTGLLLEVCEKNEYTKRREEMETSIQILCCTFILAVSDVHELLGPLHVH